MIGLDTADGVALVPSSPFATRSRTLRLRRFASRNRYLTCGLIILAGILLASLVGPSLSPYDPAAQDWNDILGAPSRAHPLGTDDLGRDELTRLLVGARLSIMIAVSVAVGASVTGACIGVIAGFFGGWIDRVLMRLMDGLYAFPSLVLAIALVGTLGSGVWQSIVAISIVAVPRFARLMRAQTIRLRYSDFVTASYVAGASTPRLILRHVVPNAVGVVIVVASSTAGFAVLTEASLSFLGLGVRPPNPAWGSMLKSGYQFLSQAPWLAVVPGLAISLLVLALNLIGDGLRDLLDPRSR
jgi:peptide/nickel transport system permease protein